MAIVEMECDAHVVNPNSLDPKEREMAVFLQNIVNQIIEERDKQAKGE